MSSEEIVRGVHLHVRETAKFKTQAVGVTFLWPMRSSLRAESFLLSYLLADTTEHFPRKQDLLARLDHLYGASLSITSIPVGSNDRLRFTLAGVHVPGLNDDLTKQLAALAAECIFCPRIENGTFPETMFRECQEQAILSVRMIKDDPQNCCAEAAALSYGGNMAGRILPSPEELEALTPERCAEAWNWIRANARIDIQALTDCPEQEVLALCRASFPFPPRRINLSLTDFQPGREGRVETARNISQSHIILLFESGILPGSRLYPAYSLGNGIFGGLPSSLLFQYVREKQRLCYSIESGLLRYDGVLRVMTAVDGPHIEKAIESILAQLEVIRSGSFSEEDLAIAKTMYINAHRSMLDDPAELLSEQYRTALMDNSPDIQTMMERLAQVEREDIVKAFEPVTLKTVSIIRQEEYGNA